MLTDQLLHDGRFELLSSLGEGGFGTVYEAIDHTLHARVALKALTRVRPDTLFRFKREFRALQDLAHPNLVTLGELFESKGLWFFTMELVPGEDFFSFVRPTRDTFHEPRLRASLLQLVEGLGALHGAGMIHRDVKPSNIRITEQGRLVLLDFGLITHGDHKRQSTHEEAFGTATYMAPEQAFPGPLSSAADWYSVGVVLYEALVGTPPFEGGALEVLLRKQGDPPVAPSTRVAGVPPDLDLLCCQLLQVDPSLRTSGAELVLRLRATCSASSPTTLSSSVGTNSNVASLYQQRESELALLASVIATSRASATHAIHVHGPPGIGKTALIHHFTDELKVFDPKSLVLLGRCFERESLPYKAFDGVIDEVCAFLRRLSADECAGVLPLHLVELARVFPVLNRVPEVARRSRPLRPPVEGRAQRERAFAALRELFVRLARRVRLVLVIDDLQWADADSLRLLEALLAPPEAPSLCLIVVGRDLSECPAPIQTFITGLAGVSGRNVDLEICPLDFDAARDLATQLLVHYGGEPKHAEFVARESAGQPLWIDELARFAATHAASETPPDLDQLLGARIAGLDAAPARVLELVALAGVCVPQDVVIAAAMVAPDAQLQVIHGLRQARLIGAGLDAGRAILEPLNERVRMCVVNALPEATRRSSYRALARAMQATSVPDPAALALFWAEAGEPDRAAQYALEAGDRARDGFAFERAASLYRRVLDAGATRDRRWQLFGKLGEALANAGHCHDAAEAFLLAAEEAPEDEQLELRRRACQQLLQGGHLDRGLAVADDLLASVGVSLPKTPTRALRSLLWQRVRLAARGDKFEERAPTALSPAKRSRIDVLWSVATSLSSVDHIRALELETRLLRHSLDAGEPRRIARSLALESCLMHPVNANKRMLAGAAIERARRLAARHDDSHALGLCYLAEGLCDVADSRLRRGLERGDAAVTMFRDHCMDVTWERNSAATLGLTALCYLGDHEELARRVPTLLRDARQRGDLYAHTSCVLTGGCLLSLVYDQPEAALAQVNEAISRWSSSGFYLQHFMHMLARTQIDLYEGDRASEIRAHQFVVACWPALVASQLTRAEFVSWPSMWARGRAAIAASNHLPMQRANLLRAALADGKRLERYQTVLANGCGALLQAGALGALGQLGEAHVALQQACVMLERAEASALLWSARVRLAELDGDLEGIERGMAWMHAQGVTHPERFINMHCRALAGR